MPSDILNSKLQTQNFSIASGARKGKVAAPPSKSHEHRLLIADFLAGDRSRLAERAGDADDVKATKRCLAALAEETSAPTLDCGESGSTRRFLAPVAAALGKRPVWKMAGRLASRPMDDHDTLAPGKYEIAGNVSSQFVTGLLFALPLLDGDSQIRFTAPLESRGYVDLTLAVLAGAGVRVDEIAAATPNSKLQTQNQILGFDVPGRQRFRAQPSVAVEGDWSGAAFWLAMDALGSEIEVTGLNVDSAQPDRRIVSALAELCGDSTRWGHRVHGESPSPNSLEHSNTPTLEHSPTFPLFHSSTFPLPHSNTPTLEHSNTLTLDVSQFPDSFPALCVVAARQERETRFVGVRRLRMKECDRVAAMAEMLAAFGVATETAEDSFVVRGTGGEFAARAPIRTFGDHRIAMSAAVAASASSAPVVIDDAACSAKSYPGFFSVLASLAFA